MFIRVLQVLALLVPLSGVAAAADDKIMIVTWRGCEEACRAARSGVPGAGSGPMGRKDMVCHRFRSSFVIQVARHGTAPLLSPFYLLSLFSFLPPPVSP